MTNVFQLLSHFSTLLSFSQNDKMTSSSTSSDKNVPPRRRENTNSEIFKNDLRGLIGVTRLGYFQKVRSTNFLAKVAQTFLSVLGLLFKMFYF